MDVVDKIRYYRALAYQGLHRGELPTVDFTTDTGFRETLGRGIIFGIAFCIAAFFLGTVFNKSSEITHQWENIAFVIGFLIGTLLPYVKVFAMAVIHWQKPDFNLLHHFSLREKIVANAIIALLLLSPSMSIYDWIVGNHLLVQSDISVKNGFKETNSHYYHQIYGRPGQAQQNALKAPEMPFSERLYLWAILTIGLCGLSYWLSQKPLNPKRSQKVALKNIQRIPFGLWLGHSTGELANLYHEANIASSLHVGLFLDDVAQNILVLGGIGSGKTTGIMHPLLLQLFDQKCGGIIFDIKGDFHQSVTEISRKSSFANVITIGINDSAFNLLDNLSPEIASSFLKSTLLITSPNRNESFWIETATELCRNALGVLSFSPLNYSLNGLYHYLFDREWQQSIINEVTELQEAIEPDKQRLLKSYLNYENHIFKSFDEKVKAGVKATIAQLLAPFNHPNLIDTFCTKQISPLSVESVLQNKVFLLNLPLAQWGLGAKVIYTFFKLRFFNIMQQRKLHADWNQDNYVFFMCDEYQEIINANRDGLSDLNFWDKSRSSKTVGIISAQSISSFYAAIGDRDIANALLQNFRQKICFRTEDQITIDYFAQLMGTVQVHKISESKGFSNASDGKSNSNHNNHSQSISIEEKHLINGQFFRNLSLNYALASLSFNGYSYDDILKIEGLLI